MKKLALLCALIALVSFGFLSGWFVGASQTPVVAAFLPLLFGLITLFVASLLDNVKKRKEYNDILQDLKRVKNIGELAKFTNRNEDARIYSYVIIGSICVLLFCATTYIGVEFGTNVRTPRYSFQMESFIPDSSNISPVDYSLIYKVTLYMQSIGIEESEARKILKQTVGRLFTEGKDFGQTQRTTMLTDMVNNIMNITSNVSRGPRRD